MAYAGMYRNWNVTDSKKTIFNLKTCFNLKPVSTIATGANSTTGDQVILILDYNQWWHNFAKHSVTGVTAILAVKLKMINQDRMIFGDFPVNFEPISSKIFRGYFLLKS